MLSKNCGFKIILLLMLTHSLFDCAKAVEMPVIDRAVMQVGRSIYTQQEIEWYVLCRVLLNPDDPIFKDFSKEIKTRWTHYLQMIEPDFVMLDDAQRLNVFVPRRELLDKSKDFIYGRINENPTYATWVQTAELGEANIAQNILRILQIEAYKQSKQRYGQRQPVSPPENRSSQAEEWYGEIFAKSQLKYYRNAFVYQPLHKLTEWKSR